MNSSNTKKIYCDNNEELYSTIIESQLPEDEDVKLWRYMSIDKFVLMLISKKIYIPSLASFDDQLEGRATIDIYKRHIDHAPDDLLNIAQNNFYSLCFHQLQHENELMWRAYAPQGGVALATTVRRLKEAAFEVDSINHRYYLLKVNYDYTNSTGKLHPIAAKEKEFSPENEYRMIFGRHTHFVKDNIDEGRKNQDAPPNISMLFKPEQFQAVFNEIWISPNHHTIVKEIVKRLTTDLGLKIQINSSNIKRE